MRDEGLFTDLYQLNMIQGYLERGMNAEAVFEFFVRRLPEERNFLLAAGLEQALTFLHDLRFERDELDWLAASGHVDRSVVDYLAGFRFAGDVYAMPEGTVFFADEPILRVVAPLPQAQLVESRLINILQFQTVIASKAARMVLAAPGKRLVDFGFRRAHGAEAGLLAARAAYLAGFTGSATVAAERRFGIPAIGTVAHSFIQAHDNEEEAFINFARTKPGNAVLLIDTYDTVAAARKVATLAADLKAEGIALSGVRLDSGDLAVLAKEVRAILDRAGLEDVAIFASSSIDEYVLQAMRENEAPIDGFGIGTKLVTSADAPYLDCAYKLQEYAGKARRKRSAGKATWPGRKQVYRRYGADDRIECDIVTLEGDEQPGVPLLRCVMKNGEPVDHGETLAQGRERASQALASLPDDLRGLKAAEPYGVQISSALRDLADQTDRMFGRA
jgi:nicotinate phosphoribosyltransferase